MESHSTEGGFFRSRAGLVLIGFAIVAAYYLWTEHRVHLLSALPLLLLLSCPLMHLFMHGGHGGHGGHKGHDAHGDAPPPSRPSEPGEKQP